MFWRLLSVVVSLKTMSWPNEFKRRWTFDEHGSSGYFELAVNKVVRNSLISLERFILFSLSWEHSVAIATCLY